MKRLPIIAGSVLLAAGCNEFDLVDLKDQPNRTTSLDSGSNEIWLELDDSGTEMTETEEVTPPLEEEGTFTPAEAVIYVHESDSLWSWDADSLDMERIGSFSGDFDFNEQMTDIAIDSEGRMIGCSSQSLYLIDPETAETVWLGSLPTALWGLSFVDGDILIGAGSGVFVLDPTDASIEDTIIPTDFFYQTSGDLVGLPDGNLYWTVRDPSGGPDLLAVIDPRVNEPTVQGSAVSYSLWGMAYGAGQLFGFNADGQVVRLHPSGGGEYVQTQTNRSWWGATTNPARW